MDDFTVHGDPFDECLYHFSFVLQHCIETNLVLNFEKCHFIVELRHVVCHPRDYRLIRLK